MRMHSQSCFRFTKPTAPKPKRLGHWLAGLALGWLSVSGVMAEDSLLNLGAEAEKLETAESQTQAGAPSNADADAETDVDKGGFAKADADKKSEDADASNPATPSWGYHDQKAPRHWAELSPDFVLCDQGQSQSPINIQRQKAVGTTGLPGFDVYYRKTALKTVFDGRHLKVTIPVGSYINLENRRYELTHYQLHTPSEHQLDGFAYPAELQLVHDDGQGNQVAVSVLFREGDKNPHLETLLQHLPKAVNEPRVTESVQLHPAKFLPGTSKFYKYHGSMTYPPCHQNVYWMVFAQPLEASVGQLQKLQAFLGNNARPVQPLKARTLLKSWADQPPEMIGNEFYYTP